MDNLGPYSNPYAEIQQQKEQANKLTSERERIRNVYIDQVGSKPSEEEIDAILAISLKSAGSSQQQSSTLLQQPPLQDAGTMPGVV